MKQEIAVWMVVCMVPAITAIPILYHWRQEWWSDQYGRAFMVLAVGLALLVNFAVTFQFVPEFPGKGWVKLGVYSILLVAFYWLAWLMWRTPAGRERLSR